MNQLDLQTMAHEEQEKQAAFHCRILCCASTPCLASGGATVQSAITDLVKERGLSADVQIVPTGCMGPCSRGPMVTLEIDGKAPIIYERVTTEMAVDLVDRHLAATETLPKQVMSSDLPFFARQTKIVLAN
ncbi:MAG: (2Fe-2S) ferredoxin domain-containing protein, partial [Caldilineaceae bacterium]|nr:(2Fe-2S) ferredoxin domain-containing protein [Caldilineaceae bacterium]